MREQVDIRYMFEQIIEDPKLLFSVREDVLEMIDILIWAELKERGNRDE